MALPLRTGWPPTKTTPPRGLEATTSQPHDHREPLSLRTERRAPGHALLDPAPGDAAGGKPSTLNPKPYTLNPKP